MTALLLRIWASLLLLPAIPVMAFYLVFNRQNYFELQDTARGIVATGPIAAYIALVLIGWTIYKRVSNLTGEVSPLQSRILGSWDYVATSVRGTKRQGSAEISEDHGQICMSGSFQDNDKPSGQWSSMMARIELQQLVVLYQLEDIRPQGRRTSTAVFSVQINPKAVNKMSGNWVVLGQADALGDIVFTRAAQ